MSFGGLLVLFTGHFVGLLAPIWMFDAIGISHGFKQAMAIVIGGVAAAPGILDGQNGC